MSQVEEKLMKLYWKLWTSANFENDFQKDWRAVYERLQAGDHYSIPPQVVEMCFQYLIDWGKEG